MRANTWDDSVLHWRNRERWSLCVHLGSPIREPTTRAMERINTRACVDMICGLRFELMILQTPPPPRGLIWRRSSAMHAQGSRTASSHACTRARQKVLCLCVLTSSLSRELLCVSPEIRRWHHRIFSRPIAS